MHRCSLVPSMLLSLCSNVNKRTHINYTSPIHTMARPDRQARPACFIDHLSPNAPDSLPPWYKNRAANDSLDIEDSHRPTYDFLTCASTPLHLNKSVLFASPMKRLDKLHLSSAVETEKKGSEDGGAETGDNSNDHDDHDDDGDQDDDDHFDVGNQTIITKSDSENETDILLSTQPSFITQRKRKRLDSSMDVLMSPADLSADHTIPHGSAGKDMSGIVGNDTTDMLRVSFSSDSTPCPVQPRKRLKFKDSHDTTPSQPSRVSKPLLNLSSSRKLSATNVPLLSKLNNATDSQDTDCSSPPADDFSQAKTNLQSTPVSQSTPANSRAPSPALLTETSEEVNGYKFVKPDPKYKYQTPQSRLLPVHTAQHSSRLLNSYHSNDFSEISAGKYKIVGDFPVTAAGFMDEEDEEIHVGDKRINDPYLVPSPTSNSPSFSKDTDDLRNLYMSSDTKLPLLAHFERELGNDEMDELINDGSSVPAFYKQIVPDDMVVFLKKERLRWHPDKWHTRLELSPFTKANIDNVSQVINALIESLQI